MVSGRFCPKSQDPMRLLAGWMEGLVSYMKNKNILSHALERLKKELVQDFRLTRASRLTSVFAWYMLGYKEK